MRKNNASKWSAISLLLTVVGAGMFVAGILLDSYDTTWLIMVGLMLALTFLICFFIFAAQARQLNQLFEGSALLVRWEYGEEAGRQYAQEETHRAVKHNRFLLLLITGFFVVIAGVFALFGFEDGEERLTFLAIMGGVLLLVWISALLAPTLSHNTMRRSEKAAYVGVSGAWVMGQYHIWASRMSHITGVRIFRSEGTLLLFIGYDTMQRYGWRPVAVYIPIPLGREGEAMRAADTIATVHGLRAQIDIR